MSLDIGCQVGRGPMEQAAWHSCGGIPATPSVQEHPKPALKVNMEEAGMLQGIRPSLLLTDVGGPHSTVRSVYGNGTLWPWCHVTIVLRDSEQAEG